MVKMMNMFFKNVSQYLPLHIQEVSWDEVSLNLNGEGWYFNLNSVWRLTDGEKMLVGCYDDRANEYVDNLVGLDVIDIYPFSTPLSIDPVLNLSNGLRLEVFSLQSLEPWRMRIFDDEYFAEPSVAEHIK
jgi:hypothetical protein